MGCPKGRAFWNKTRVDPFHLHLTPARRQQSSSLRFDSTWSDALPACPQPLPQDKMRSTEGGLKAGLEQSAHGCEPASILRPKAPSRGQACLRVHFLPGKPQPLWTPAHSLPGSWKGWGLPASLPCSRLPHTSLP